MLREAAFGGAACPEGRTRSVATWTYGVGLVFGVGTFFFLGFSRETNRENRCAIW